MTGLIEIEGLQYTYPQSRRPALEDLSLKVDSGEFVLLAGPSGAGKSTLLRCLNGLIPHFSGGIVEGSVTVGGYDVLEAGPHALSRVVGFVFQDPESQIVVDEVESEVAFGLENAAVPAEVMRDRVEEALRIMGLENLRHRSPWTLSGGERQKLAIATVLADQPSVLALDEPTSQLDPLAARDLLQTLVRLNEELGLTIIMVEQRLERVVQYAGRLVYLERGKVTLDGPMRQELGKLDWGQRPPLARLAGSLSWSTIPLSIAEGRQMVSTDALHVHNGDGRTLENTRSTSMHQAPVLEARNLRFVYNGQEVLRGVDVQVRAGEAVVLLGPNGAGKSTLLKCLVGLLEPEFGEVFVHGRSIAGRDVAAVCRQVAYLPQNPDDLLFADSVTEELEITLANHGVNKGETALYIKDLLLELGLADSEGDYPRDLSVGQRQRVALGAVAVVAPTILLLDEPTRGLDYATKESLMSLWRRWLQAGMALLLVTHDVELATRVAQRVIVLEDGRITADGPVEDVLGTLEAFEPQMARLFPGHRWLTVAEVMAGMGSHPAGS